MTRTWQEKTKITHEYKCKDHEENVSKSNPIMYAKGNTHLAQIGLFQEYKVSLSFENQ